MPSSRVKIAERVQPFKPIFKHHPLLPYTTDCGTPEEENVDGCHDSNMVFVPWLHSSLSQLALSSYVMVAGLRLMDNLKQIQVEK